VDEQEDQGSRGRRGRGRADHSRLAAYSPADASSDVLVESFLLDQSSEHWYAGQPLHADKPVSQVINRFSPRSVPPDQWCRIEGLVRDSVRRADPSSGHLAEALMNVVTQLAVWVDTIGQPMRPDVVFHPDTRSFRARRPDRHCPWDPPQLSDAASGRRCDTAWA
jgi:hypothetical protein